MINVGLGKKKPMTNVVRIKTKSYICCIKQKKKPKLNLEKKIRRVYITQLKLAKLYIFIV